jgi:DNA ligase-1
VKAFAQLYRDLDAATATSSKQAALVGYFSAARADPSRWGSAAWTAYFLAGGKPRQMVPTRVLGRLAIEGAGLPEWLFEECYQSVGDLAETLSLLLPEGTSDDHAPLDVWLRERLLPLREVDEEEKLARLRDWSLALEVDERFALFKLITGAFRVGVSRLQVVKALAKVAGVEESRMAQRMMGYSRANWSPAAADFAALIADVEPDEGRALDEGRPYPFCLAHSWQRPLEEMAPTLGPPSEWIVEWKFDGIRGQFLNREQGWRLWSRGEELISEGYPELAVLADALPKGLALDGELVVMRVPGDGPSSAADLGGLAPFAELQQRLGRKIVGEKTMRDLPVVFIAYDLIEMAGRDVRSLPQHERRATLESLVEGALEAASARGVRLPLRLSPRLVAPDWAALATIRARARELGVEGMMLKARESVYGVGRRKGDDRTDVWWKWKLDPMSVDAVLIYAQRGHGRRSGVYSDYTFAVWNDEVDRSNRALVPFAKAYSGLSDAEMREVDAIIRKTTVESFGPVRSVTPSQVFELGFEGIAASKRHKSGVAVRFPRMLRWRRDKPVAEADTLARLREFLPADSDRRDD